MANVKSARGRKTAYDSSLQLANALGAGANKIKKQIRNVERLLAKKRDTLPDTVIVEKERTLEALRMELASAEKRALARKNAKKYHMVRFFERKKATRKYKQALRKLETSAGDDAALAELRQRELELCYVVNFPKTTKYIALYPSDEDPEAAKETAAKRDAFLKVVAKQLSEGTLPVPLEQILKGKKLNKESTGISVSDSEEEGEPSRNVEPHDEEDEDDFFE
ncbi:AaceriABR143Cp [[Ashbya] aceris (nom. inval.)]|nr:AaceriABR143Cp [[Ashbya] aceris (nom. inval.)]